MSLESQTYKYMLEIAILRVQNVLDRRTDNAQHAEGYLDTIILQSRVTHAHKTFMLKEIYAFLAHLIVMDAENNQELSNASVVIQTCKGG